MPPFAISDSWDVAGLVLTVVGFLLTLLSLWYAIIQVRKTASAAVAAKLAAEEAVRESRRSYQRYEVAVVLRLVSEVRTFVELRDWPSAALRVSDLADRVAQLANLSTEWQTFISELRDWSSDFARFAKGGSPRYSVRKWKDLVQKLQEILDRSHGPFTTL